MKSHLFQFAVLLLPVTCMAVAPPNDSFSARIPLPGNAEVSTTGNNTDATLETNENNLDSIGGRSVWWKWTAPASGWVSVDTSGSEIDTVLAVLADGPALKDTYVVGFNDESGDPAAPPGGSRVIFQATAGTEYHIAIHGFIRVQGIVALNIHSGVTPPLRVTSLTLTPGSVNVTTAAQTITADIGIASDAGFTEGVLALHRANFSGVTEIPLLPANRISGTANAGVYRVAVTIPRYSSPGTWLLEVAASDALGREAVYGRGVAAAFEYDHVLPDGLTGLFSVANTGAVDETAPALLSFAISPSTANVVVNPAALTFTFRLTDALSGFGRATLTIYTPGGEALTALPVTAAQRTLGTALDGTYSVPFTLPAKMPGGQWSVSLLVRDATNNPALFDGAVNGEPFPIGATDRFSVSGAPHSYWAWMYPRAFTSPGTQPGDDLDGDGTINLMEYAFGLTVDQNDSAAGELRPGEDSTGLPYFNTNAEGLTLNYTRRSAASFSGISYTAQFGSALNDWLSVSGGTISPVNEVFEQVTVTDPAPGPRRFGRLKVTLAE